MRIFSSTRVWFVTAVGAMLCISACAAAATTATNTTARKKTVSHASSTSTAHKKKSRGKAKSKTAKSRGQNAIESERAEQIQEALIREHYMSGEPSGKWDDATQAALRRYQAAQGWQAKSVPDSRALIKLGLGPSHDHLLNPETAMTTGPTEHKAAKASAQQPTPDVNTPTSSGVPQQ
jgi:hypothetical protein